MTDNKVHNLFFVCIFLCLFGLFCYFRLKPIQLQTVPYTYDQGRDFLKAQEIIRDRNPTFIGPTTGIQGLFHGAWWYFFLTIPYIIFSADPLGFYYFIFFTSLLQTLLFSFFLKREFGTISGLLFFNIVTISPYFISTAIFPISSIFTMPFILLLFYAIYQYKKAKKEWQLFLVFFSLAMIFEAEIPLGLFIVPAFFTATIITGYYKIFFNKPKKISIAGAGFLFPFLPRLLFELKNNFAQSKSAFHFFLNPTHTNATTFKGVFLDRIIMFKGYFFSLIPNDNRNIAIIILIIAILGLLFFYKKLNKVKREYVFFIIIFLVFLFLATLAFRDNFFWGNYLEGLPYFYLLFIIVGLSGLSQSNINIVRVIPTLVLIIVFLISFVMFYSGLQKKAPVPLEGLRVQKKAVDYLYSNVGTSDFCGKIYTPPVIPFTYNYLFNYRAMKDNMKLPKPDFINKTCWYIIEHDDNKERRNAWMTENIPVKGKKGEEYIVGDELIVFPYTIK